VQIDSINVVARSHELVLGARAGAVPEALFDRVVYRQRAAFEYWGHAASYLPMETYRLFLPRVRRGGAPPAPPRPMETYRLFLPRMRRMRATTRGWWSQVRERHRELYAPVLERIR